MLLTTPVRRRLIAAATILGLLAAPLVGGAAEAKKPAHPPGKPVTVMTRNLYLGADIQRPVTAAVIAQQLPGATPESVLVALGNATHVTRAIVDQTNFDVRSRLLADEIARTEPDLVGLQEVAWWRHGDLQLTQVGVRNATQTDYDFLQILMDDLAAVGAHYVPVSIAPRADVEGPSFTGSPFNGTMGADARDVRLTMRDVILMHVEDGLSVTGEGQQVYTANLIVNVAGVQTRFDRGYQWVDVRAGSTRFRFVNTHLEAFSSDLALLQTKQMMLEAPATDRTTVIVCDCNSDPLNSSTKPQDHVPHKAPYEWITIDPRLHRRVARVGTGQPGLDVRPLGARERRDGGQVRPPHRHGLRQEGRRRRPGRRQGPGHGHHGRDEGPDDRSVALGPRRRGAAPARPLNGAFPGSPRTRSR